MLVNSPGLSGSIKILDPCDWHVCNTASYVQLLRPFLTTPKSQSASEKDKKEKHVGIKEHFTCCIDIKLNFAGRDEFLLSMYY